MEQRHRERHTAARPGWRTGAGGCLTGTEFPFCRVTSVRRFVPQQREDTARYELHTDNDYDGTFYVACICNT